MADNIDVTPGTGKTIGADEVASVLYQRVKVVWGPDGTVNDVDTASGKRLPVQASHVAAEYVSRDALKEVTAAINRLGDRLDNLFTQLMTKQ